MATSALGRCPHTQRTRWETGFQCNDVHGCREFINKGTLEYDRGEGSQNILISLHNRRAFLNQRGISIPHDLWSTREIRAHSLEGIESDEVFQVEMHDLRKMNDFYATQELLLE